MDWLADRLKAALRWQIANPGAIPDHDAPTVPAAGRRVWGMFLALHATRGAGFSGPLPISFGEIEAWSRTMREPVRTFELEIIRALDRTFIDAAHDGADADETRAGTRERFIDQFRRIADQAAAGEYD